MPYYSTRICSIFYVAIQKQYEQIRKVKRNKLLILSDEEILNISECIQSKTCIKVSSLSILLYKKLDFILISHDINF